MASTTMEDRRKREIALAEKAAAVAEGHRARARLQRAKGKEDKAREADAAAERQERIAEGHRREGDRFAERERERVYRLEAATKTRQALEARTAAQAALRPTVDPFQAYMQAIDQAEEIERYIVLLEGKETTFLRQGVKEKAQDVRVRITTRQRWAADWRRQAEVLIASTGQNFAVLRQAAISDAGKQARQRAKEAGRLEDLNIESEGATAAAQRAYVAGGARKERVVSLAEYALLITRPQDRTAARLEAMHSFDGLCALADAGLFPSPKFESESRSGHGPGALIMEERAAGLREMDELRHVIGGKNVEMLRARIYERQSLTALMRAGYGTEKTAGALVLAAVDALSVWFKTRNALRARLAPEAGRQPSQRPAPASGGQGSAPPQ